MGDLVNFEAQYPKAFRQALDGTFEAVAKITDSDDSDDQAGWNASLWPAARNAEFYKSFQAPMTAESGGSDHAFYGVTKYVADIELSGEAAQDFNTSKMQQDWASELARDRNEISSTSDVRIHQQFDTTVAKCGALGGTPCYVDLDAIRVWQKNVVFPFKGELRRGKVCLWSDFQSAIALPRDYGNTARELMNRSIRSAAKEFALRR